MKNELYRTSRTLDVDIGDMTVSLFNITASDDSVTDYTSSHFHTAYELQYVNQGQLSILDETKTHRVTKGCFVIVPPGTFHSNNSDEKFVRSTLRFSITSNGKEETDFSEYCYYSRILRRIKGITVFECEEAENAVRYLSVTDTKNPAYIHMVKLYAGLVITTVLQQISTHKAIADGKRTHIEADALSAVDERIKFIIENCIQKHFADENISRIIAAKLNMSDRNCSRVVNRLMGENISCIVLRQRMKLAKLLIIKTDKHLNDIAQEVGYKTYVAFFTAFKKYYGISPIELKNSSEITK